MKGAIDCCIDHLILLYFLMKTSLWCDRDLRLEVLPYANAVQEKSKTMIIMIIIINVISTILIISTVLNKQSFVQVVSTIASFSWQVAFTLFTSIIRVFTIHMHTHTLTHSHTDTLSHTHTLSQAYEIDLLQLHLDSSIDVARALFHMR